MRGLLVVLSLVVCLALGGGVYAGEPPVPIEGKLLVSLSSGFYVLEGSSDNRVDGPGDYHMVRISPCEDKLVHDVFEYWASYWDHPCDVWVSDCDGGGAVNLTGPEHANMGGINCQPYWSPDGSQISFTHVDPVMGEYPCETGFEMWAMDADGSNVHRVTPELNPCQIFCGGWSPNGYRLRFDWNDQAYTIDSDGTDMELIPNVGANSTWSADGSKLASSGFEIDVVDGEPGTWRQLLVTDVATGECETLIEHFVPNSVLTAAYPDNSGMQDSLLTWAGPLVFEWSPKGDRIAFLAIMPCEFDHYPLAYEEHYEGVDVWTYDLVSDDLTKITDNTEYELRLDWTGDNTFADDPEVTVDNTTVTFSNVGDEGLTTVIRDDDPPELPSGYEFCEEFYEVSTTAEIEGPISICMTYNDEDVPTGSSEADLCILHYNEAEAYWENITVSRDSENNTVCGQTDSLSVFTLSGAAETLFADVPSHGLGENGLDSFWAYDEVDACAEVGIVAGYDDGNYHPEWLITRGQMAVFIARGIVTPMGEEGGQAYEPPPTPTFPDVSADYWAYKHIELLSEEKIVEGYPDGCYRPSEVVTRAQMAAYMARSICDPRGEDGLAGYTPPAEPSFPDVGEEHWARTYVEYAKEQGVVQGYNHGFYMPNNTVTRAQMAVYVARAFGLTS